MTTARKVTRKKKADAGVAPTINRKAANWAGSNELGDQGQREEAVGDGAAEGSEFGLFRIDVDELMVTGAFGELVDTFLIDLNPVGESKVLAHAGKQFLESNVWHSVSWGGAVCCFCFYSFLFI